MPIPALIVEDNTSDLLAAQAVLTADWSLLHARTIPAAVVLAQELFAPAAAATPGLVLVDMHLPLPHDEQGMDGYYLLAHLYQLMLQGQLQPVALAAISADMTAERRQRCAEAGAMLILEKPLLPEHSTVLLELAQATQHAPLRAPATPLLAVASEVVRFLLRTTPRPTSNLITSVDARALLTLFATALHFASPQERAAAEELVRRLGGQRHVRQLLKQFQQQLRAIPPTPLDERQLSKLLEYLVYGVTQEAILRLTGLGRRRFNTRLSQLTQALADFLNSPAAQQL